MYTIHTVDVPKLRLLANLLDTVPSSKFEITTWGEITKPTLFQRLFKSRECGFAGCAIGWAAHSGIFPELSLSYMSIGNNTLIGVPTYDGFNSSEAICSLFQISNKIVNMLFFQQAYDKMDVTPDMVASRINRFCDKIEFMRASARVKVDITEVVQQQIQKIRELEPA
jgi:hypothetical protein